MRTRQLMMVYTSHVSCKGRLSATRTPFCPRPSIRQRFCVYCAHKRPTFSRAVASCGQQHVYADTVDDPFIIIVIIVYSVLCFMLALLFVVVRVYSTAEDRATTKKRGGETENLTDPRFYVSVSCTCIMKAYTFFFYTYLYIHSTYVVSGLIFSSLYLYRVCVWYSHTRTHIHIYIYILYTSMIYIHPRVTLLYSIFGFSVYSGFSYVNTYLRLR
jgi:hypothetical protein